MEFFFSFVHLCQKICSLRKSQYLLFYSASHKCVYVNVYYTSSRDSSDTANKKKNKAATMMYKNRKKFNQDTINSLEID